MTLDRRLLAGALGLSLIVAACGGSSTPSSAAGTAPPSAAATEAAPTEAAPTEVATETEVAPTEAATETETATDNGGTGGQINGLAAMIPAEAGGIKLERAGYDGNQLGMFGAAAGLNSEELDPILKANGKTLKDVNFAIATSTSDTGGMIYAVQIVGVPATKFAAAVNQDLGSMPSKTLGGKTVYGEASTAFGFFAYPKDDILFMILLFDEKTAGAILEKLP